MNPNAIQALEDEKAGIEELGEDIDYNAVYGGEDVDTTPPPKSQEIKNGYMKIFGDVAKQFSKETLIGIGGTYGDLSELAGAKGGQTPNQVARNENQFDIMKKMQAPDYQPSFSDIDSLSDDSELVPNTYSLPTSEDLRNLNDEMGGPGEAETGPGKYAARSGKFYGTGLAFGQGNPIPAIVGGIAGQGVEDLNGGPLLQTAAEIASMFLSHVIKGKPLVGSAKKEVQDKINSLRNLGYTEEDITLAINSASNGKKIGINASKNAKTEKAFENFAENSDKIVSGILEAEVPGIERGIKNVHDMASQAYGQVAQEASKLPIKNTKPFMDSVSLVEKELTKTLGKNPEAEGFIHRLFDAATDPRENPTAENFMNFYKELNGMGNWMGRSQKDRLISKVKDGIKETFRSEGKQGKELADKFEKANAGIRKAYLAEDAHDLIQKVTTQEGIDYKKLNKLFDKPENIDLFKDVLGDVQTRNLHTIAKTGKDIKDFDKAWKATNELSKNVNLAQTSSALYFLSKGDWVGLAGAVGSKVSMGTAKKLAELSLRSPKFQNLMIRGLHAIKSNSPQTFRSVKEAMQKYLDEEGLEIPLD